VPNLDVLDDDDNRLHRTAVAQVFAFVLQAVRTAPPPASRTDPRVGKASNARRFGPAHIASRAALSLVSGTMTMLLLRQLQTALALAARLPFPVHASPFGEEMEMVPVYTCTKGSRKAPIFGTGGPVSRLSMAQNYGPEQGWMLGRVISGQCLAVNAAARLQATGALSTRRPRPPSGKSGATLVVS